MSSSNQREEEEILRENAREVEKLHLALASDVDLRGVSIQDYERTQGWLSVKIFTSSFAEPVSLFIELPPGYPNKEPPRFFFPRHVGHKLLDNLTQMSHEMARVYQDSNRNGGRCLEYSLSFITQALANLQQPSGISHSSTQANLFASASSFSLDKDYASPSVGSVLLGSSNLLAGSISDFSGSFSLTPQYPLANSPTKSESPARFRLQPPLSVDDPPEPLDLDGSPRSSSSRRSSNLRRKPSDQLLAGPNSSATGISIPMGGRRRPRCGASFSSNDQLVVFTYTNDSQRPSSNANLLDSVWDTEDESEDDSSERSSLARSMKEYHKIAFVSASPFSLVTQYEMDSNQNASLAPSPVAKMAWHLLEKGSDNPLTKVALQRLVVKLEQERDFCTLAMLSARAKLLQKESLLNIEEGKGKRYRAMYRIILQRSGKFIDRCSLHKLDPTELEVNLVSSTFGLTVGETIWSYDPKIRCSLCRLFVTTSMIALCVKCGHGGHTNCLSEWFENETSCPFACGCSCF